MSSIGRLPQRLVGAALGSDHVAVQLLQVLLVRAQLVAGVRTMQVVRHRLQLGVVPSDRGDQRADRCCFVNVLCSLAVHFIAGCIGSSCSPSPIGMPNSMWTLVWVGAFHNMTTNAWAWSDGSFWSLTWALFNQCAFSCCPSHLQLSKPVPVRHSSICLLQAMNRTSRHAPAATRRPSSAPRCTRMAATSR